MLCKKKICKSGFLSALLILKKQSQDERFPSHLKGSSTVDSFPNMEPDSLLLPFVNNPQPSEKPEITRLSNKTSPRRSNSDDDTLERYKKSICFSTLSQMISVLASMLNDVI